MSDWSSDVCSSDLITQPVQTHRGACGATTAIEHAAVLGARPDSGGAWKCARGWRANGNLHLRPAIAMHAISTVKLRRERKTVALGKRGSGRVALGCRRKLQKKQPDKRINDQ